MPTNKLNHLIVSWGIVFVLGAVVGYAMGRGSGTSSSFRPPQVQAIQQESWPNYWEEAQEKRREEKLQKAETEYYEAATKRLKYGY